MSDTPTPIEPPEEPSEESLESKPPDEAADERLSAEEILKRKREAASAPTDIYFPDREKLLRGESTDAAPTRDELASERQPDVEQAQVHQTLDESPDETAEEMLSAEEILKRKRKAASAPTDIYFPDREKLLRGESTDAAPTRDELASERQPDVKQARVHKALDLPLKTTSTADKRWTRPWIIGLLLVSLLVCILMLAFGIYIGLSGLITPI